MKCPKCYKNIDVAFDSCGTGTTWSLLKCNNCEQLVATGRIIPKEVISDPDVICIHTMKSAAFLFGWTGV